MVFCRASIACGHRRDIAFFHYSFCRYIYYLRITGKRRFLRDNFGPGGWSVFLQSCLGVCYCFPSRWSLLFGYCFDVIPVIYHQPFLYMLFDLIVVISLACLFVSASVTSRRNFPAMYQGTSPMVNGCLMSSSRSCGRRISRPDHDDGPRWLYSWKMRWGKPRPCWMTSGSIVGIGMMLIRGTILFFFGHGVGNCPLWGFRSGKDRGLSIAFNKMK